MLSINTVAAKLGLSVHQLRRWELMFGLEIKRGRGQQRQYRSEDLTVLERIKELVEQGWPTSQIRPQLEAEGLITPKLIGVPQQPGNPEMLMEAIIGLRSFSERRFIEISKQIDELRQLMISITLRNELKNELSSPWQPVEEEFAPPPPQSRPEQEFSIGPDINVALPSPVVHSAPPPATVPPKPYSAPAKPSFPAAPTAQESSSAESADAPEDSEEDDDFLEQIRAQAKAVAEATAAATAAAALSISANSNADFAPAAAASSTPPSPPPPSPPPTEPAPAAPAQAPTAPASESARAIPRHGLGEVTDQNYLTVLGKALDMIGWSDEQADQYSKDTFGVSHWDELGRSQAEKLISVLLDQIPSSSDQAKV